MDCSSWLLNLSCDVMMITSNFVIMGNKMQMLQPGSTSSINLDTINCLAERIFIHPEKYIPWITQSCKDLELSKTIFFLAILQSLLVQKNSMPLISSTGAIMYFLFTQFALSLLSRVSFILNFILEFIFLFNHLVSSFTICILAH